MSFSPIHRVVTGHDANGDAVVTSEGPLSTVIELQAVPGTMLHEVWCTSASPPIIDNGPDPTAGSLMLAPPRHGTRVRFVDFPPETQPLLSPGQTVCVPASRRSAPMTRQRRTPGHHTLSCTGRRPWIKASCSTAS